MRVIIAGSRNFNDYLLLERTMKIIKDKGIIIEEVLSGTARGADALGEKWAATKRIPLKRFPAEWEKYGRSAGIKRNYTMVNNAEGLVAFWDGKSKGTNHIIEHARQQGLFVYVVRFQTP